MISPISLKLVTPSDVDELLFVSRKTLYDAFAHRNNPDDFEAYTSVAFTREKLLSEIETPNSFFYFAQLDGDTVGYIKLNYADAQVEFQDPKAVEINRLYVLEGQQGKQIGKQMMAFATKMALEKKLHYIWLGTWEKNHDAIRFYEREGFKIFSSYDFWVGNDKQLDWLLKKELR